ncbi:MAG: hypothetical protein IT313_03240 [Anaerolineales bacterium]|nr:hypothetical protein [Anaerolineales bacterium]
MKAGFNQNCQVTLILNEIADANSIVIVACDCNSYDTSSSYRSLDQVLYISARSSYGFEQIDFPPNVKRDVSPLHIDYIWYKGEVLPAGTYKVSDSGGSDHLPVLSIFVINPEAK